MGKKGPFYHFRRKIQVLAYDLTSAEMMSRIYFRIRMKKKLNLADPQTFNEKIQWYKLHTCMTDPRIPLCADKYRIREYLKEKDLLDYAVPLLGFWERAEDIDWDSLPDRFVLKCNHGCAYNILCQDKRTFDREKAGKQLNRWMREDFGKFNAEPHYDKIRKGILCEEFLDDGGETLTDYKFHCFNSQVRFVLVCTDRTDSGADYAYYDLDWKPLDYMVGAGAGHEKPESFGTMLEISQKIAGDFPFVRVDFYEVQGKPMLGELTFVPCSGLDFSIRPEADLEMGRMLNLNQQN